MNAVYYQAFLQSVEKWPKALCRSLLELTPRFGPVLQDAAPAIDPSGTLKVVVS